MEVTVKVKPTTEEIAEMLFDLDNKEMADVFSKLVTLFDDEYERKIAAKEPVFIFGLNYFMLYVIQEMDEKGLDFIRSAYGSMVYKFCDDITKKHLLKYS